MMMLLSAPEDGDGDDDGDKDDDLGGFSLRCKMTKGRGEHDEHGGCQ